MVEFDEKGFPRLTDEERKEVRAVQTETMEESIGKKSLKDVKSELAQTLQGKQYRNELIRATLKEKAALRRTFAVVILLSPARFGEIKEKVFISKNAIYTHLYQLKELGLVEKVAIMDLWNKRKLEGAQKEVMKKFKEFTSKMVKAQEQYFAAKTNYWALTELGKDTKIINWVLRLEKEFKNE